MGINVSVILWKTKVVERSPGWFMFKAEVRRFWASRKAFAVMSLVLWMAYPTICSNGMHVVAIFAG
jgi:hypothetical protein